MQEINTENDNHVFKIGIKNKGTIFVDGFELASRCSEIQTVIEGKDPNPKDIAIAMRDVAWGESCELDQFTDHELFSAGTKALVAIDKLGNA